ARPYGLFRLPAEILLKDNVVVPPALDRIVARALAHEPRDRYPDASVMLADFLAGEEGLTLAPLERPNATGPNPLLVGLARESFLDTVIIVGWVASFCALFPVIVLVATGFYTQA